MITHCANCGFDNPPGMRFCGNCGTRLVSPEVVSTSLVQPILTSPTDGLGVMMGADLAQRMLHAGVEASGQRRNVTVLFTDLTGFTELSQRIDSEQVFELIQQYIQLLCNDVYKYEGIVDKLTGDGLMALFGAPIAHENNAERAVLAALDMQTDVSNLSQKLRKDLGAELQMRVGLHSGSVVVGGIGSDLLMNYTALGDTVNLAHRIEEAALPGAILISEAVYRQVRAVFDCQQISVLNPKGISHPVVAFRVSRQKSRPEQVRGIEGLRARMIGRDAELARLQEEMARLFDQRQGHFVMITGEAGMGKSRLTAELKAHSQERFDIQVLEGQSLAYRRSVPYYIFINILYSYLGLPPNPSHEEVSERLRQRLDLVLKEQRAEILPIFEQLLSLPPSNLEDADRLRYLDAGQLRQQIFLAFRDFLILEANSRPLLIVFDDLHWADDASLELLRFLVESLPQAPIFIVGISRQVLPGMMTKIVEWAQQHLAERTFTIQLQSLSPGESNELLSQLLNIPDLPDQLRDLILKRSGGIPFYLEEILRMLIDRGAFQRMDNHWRYVAGSGEAALQGVPETLEGLILTRFDRLDRVQRHVLQVASVIGINFNLPVLADVLEDPVCDQVPEILNTLIEKEFILQQPGTGESEFTFRHILMSDAIYATILRRERSKIHGRVAEVIEKLYADRLEGQVELLANHYRWSPYLDRALRYIILAGQKAARNNTNSQARQQFEIALELSGQVEHTVDQTLAIEMSLGDSLVFDGQYPEARQHYEQGLEAIPAESAERYTEAGSGLYRRIAKTYERQGDYDQALSYLRAAQQVLDNAPVFLPTENALVRNDIGWIYFRRGNFPEAQQLLQDALSLVESSDAYDTIASIYNRLGAVAYNQGDWDLGATYLRKSIAMRESLRDLAGLASSVSNLGLLEIEMGQFDNALKNLTRSYELKNRLGQAEGIAAALNNLGWLHTERGEMEQASSYLNQALELSRQIGFSSLIRQVVRNLGEMYLATHKWQPAAQAFAETAPALAELKANDQLIDTYRLLTETSLGACDLPGAQAWFQKAQELVEKAGPNFQRGNTVQRGELLRVRGMLATRLEQWEAAHQYLNESEEIFKKLRSRLHQGRVIYQLALLAEAEGKLSGAQLRYDQAAFIFRSIGARLEEKRSREALSRLAA